MFIYLLSQTENIDWETYDSCVVIAPNEEEARKIHPNECAVNEWWNSNSQNSSWVFDISNISVKLIGVAVPESKPGVVCASFNAG